MRAPVVHNWLALSPDRKGRLCPHSSGGNTTLIIVRQPMAH